TVRQHPFTAIESPTRASSTTVSAAISMRAPPSRRSIARIRPNSSTMPVNTSALLWLVLEADVVAERRCGQQSPVAGGGDRARVGLRERRTRAGAQHRRRDAGDQPVDQASEEEGAVQRGAALDHGLEHVVTSQEIQRPPEVDASGGGGNGLDLGARRPP